MHIQVYELMVPPRAGVRVSQEQKTKEEPVLTSVIQKTLLGPVFDNHGEWPHAIIDLNICLDHARILQS
jgi:hypothetical protein